MMNLLSDPAILASLGAALLASIGVFIAMANRRLAEAHGAYVSGFASGLLVTSALLHLIPGALAEGWNFSLWILTGFVVMYLIGELFRCGAGAEHSLAAAGIAVFAIGLHSVIDGFGYPVLFALDGDTGWLAVSGLMLHELAEGVIVYMLLRSAGLPSPLSVVLAILAAGLTTPAGALASAFVFPLLDGEVQHILLALAAGAVLYVGAGHLPRHIPYAKRLGAAITFVLGAALAFALTLTHGDHSHEGPTHSDHARSDHVHGAEKRHGHEGHSH